MQISSVKSATVTTPPDPDDTDPSARPAYGDAYLALSGSWPSVGIPLNSIGVWSSLGGGSWRSVAAALGAPLWVGDSGEYWHFEGDDGWVQGLGNAFALSQSVPLSALIFDGRVQNQTTTSPPASWSKGVAYIAAPSSTDDWAGLDGKVLIAESDGVLADGDTFTAYTPWIGLTVYDIALGYDVRWSGSAWRKNTGAFKIVTRTYTADTNYSKPDFCLGIRVHAVGAGGGGAGTGGGNDGGQTAFGSLLHGGGGKGGVHATGVAGDGGTGDGDFSMSGSSGAATGGAGGASYGPYGSLNWPVHSYGKGGNGNGSDGGAGGGGAYTYKWFEASDLSDVTTIDIGAAGLGSAPGTNGNQGFMLIEEYVLT